VEVLDLSDMWKKVSEAGINEDYSEETVKEILHEVLNELYYSKSKKELKES
jgi:hypothetical protein